MTAQATSPRRSTAAMMMAVVLAIGADARADAPTDPARTPDKAGHFMLNARGGLGLGTDLIGPTTGYLRFEPQWVAAAELGWAAFGDGNGYLMLSPQMSKGAISTVRTLTGGMQYDMPLTQLAEGLFLYPRIEIGYSVIQERYATARSFTMVFNVGLKYVVKRRVNLGVEPLSWALYQIGDRYGESKWRFLGYAGVNF